MYQDQNIVKKSTYDTSTHVISLKFDNMWIHSTILKVTSKVLGQRVDSV